MDKWISGFAYRMDFGLSPFVISTVVPFVVSLVITSVIALATISFISVKAARVNPVESLTRE